MTSKAGSWTLTKGFYVLAEYMTEYLVLPFSVVYEEHLTFMIFFRIYTYG